MRESSIRARDLLANARWARAGGEIFVVRHPVRTPFFYDGFLHWVCVNFPECRRHFRLALLPCELPARRCPDVLLPWLQDPIEQWSPAAYEQAIELTRVADERGMVVVNRPVELTNVRKSRTASILARLGIRTPRTASLDSPEQLRVVLERFPRPFFIRNDDTHRTPIRMLWPGDAIEFKDLEAYSSPVAIEFIDTRSPDGLFRKYRYQAVGNHGVSVHQVTSLYWEVRDWSKLISEGVYREESDYISRPDPNHEVLQRARLALGLEFVAFDYAYDPRGRLTVWEANGYPTLRFTPGPPSLRWRDAPIHRIFAAMLGFYLEAIGARPPEAVDGLRRYGDESERILDELDADIGLMQRLLPFAASAGPLFRRPRRA